MLEGAVVSGLGREQKKKIDGQREAVTERRSESRR